MFNKLELNVIKTPLLRYDIVVVTIRIRNFKIPTQRRKIKFIEHNRKLILLWNRNICATIKKEILTQ